MPSYVCLYIMNCMFELLYSLDFDGGPVLLTSNRSSSPVVHRCRRRRNPSC
jgi:hypothetical protein